MPDDDTKFFVGTPYSMAKARLNYGGCVHPTAGAKSCCCSSSAIHRGRILASRELSHRISALEIYRRFTRQAVRRGMTSTTDDVVTEQLPHLTFRADECPHLGCQHTSAEN